MYMLNIFFISNDSRIEKLIEHFQPFFKSKIRMASDFDHGLKEVFENRPSAVFIQSDIGTVSGETVARHIKSLLGSDSPRIVFMGEGDAKSKTGNSWCDDWILLSDSEQVFQEEFVKLIAAYYPDDWNEILSGISRTVPHIPVADSEQAIHDVSDEPEVSKDGDVRGRCDTADGTANSPGSTDEKRFGTFSADMAPEDDAEVPEKTLPEHGSLGLGEYHAYDVSSKKWVAARGLRLGLFLLFVLAVAGGVMYVRSLLQHGNRLESPQPHSAGITKITGKPAIAEKKHVDGITGLPSFIHADWRQPRYTDSHPGWEKYVSADYEFLLFREKSVIRAIQVIARDKKGIPEPFMASVLKEMGIKGPLPAGVSERKEGFLVKRVLINGFAEFATYSEDGDERVKAFVLEFS
jgi:flagellar FliL protein